MLRVYRYGDVTPSTTPEVLFTIVYVAINIVVWAYVLGTITLLVTKQVRARGLGWNSSATAAVWRLVWCLLSSNSKLTQQHQS